MSYRCPRCNHGGMVVEAVQSVTAYIDREGDLYDDEGGDTEWEDASPARCTDCGFEGMANDFWENDDE